METSPPKPSASDGKVSILPLACPFHLPPLHVLPPEDSGHYPRPGEKEGRGRSRSGEEHQTCIGRGEGMQINKPKPYIPILTNLREGLAQIFWSFDVTLPYILTSISCDVYTFWSFLHQNHQKYQNYYTHHCRNHLYFVL